MSVIQDSGTYHGEGTPSDSCPHTLQSSSRVRRGKYSRVLPESDLSDAGIGARYDLPEAVYIVQRVSTDHGDKSEQEETEHEDDFQDGDPEFDFTVYPHTDPVGQSQTDQSARYGYCWVQVGVPVLENHLHG